MSAARPLERRAQEDIVNCLIGVGGFGEFSRGRVDLENTLATAVGDDDVVSVTAVGVQIGGGLRLEFSGTT